ncbi:transmembrane channel-like protein 7 [Exaiptasia diaphana]|uniref:TMC domain-containing protein n=1 Tax=Exaiptasia diaphana TaxID=2652724 RepID=A0A913XAB1_EXADI|nr:transmembrane channel-like protein 7 [Exaiptasia diaphana]KXJ26662.1 Transmembrane channel-like protein 7 [Exaiptasia diaphana]
MKSRVVPSEDNEESKNHSMELQAISTGDDPYSVDPYDLEDDDVSPQQSVSRHLPSRANTTRHGTVRRRHSSKRRGSIAVEDMEIDQQDLEPVESVKAIAAPMQQKREMRKNQAQTVKHISCWKGFKLQTSMAFHRFFAGVKEFFQDIELWKGHLKQVEGRFGNGVVSYFLFLKWMLFLNLFLFLIVFGFVGIPTIVADYHPVTYDNISTAQSTNSCVFGYPSDRYAKTSVDSLIVDFITGQGWINTTIMFYSNYPFNQKLKVNDAEYNLPLAYVLVGGAYFFVSLLMMVKNLTQSFEESYIEGGGTFYSYCNKVFASWDYCIEDENTANVKSQNIYQDINAELAEEERLEKVQSRTTATKVKLYSLRILISFLVMALLGGAIYAIYATVEVSTNPEYQNSVESNLVKTIIRSAPSLTITALNLILPPFFQILSQAEDWSPRFEVALNLWRTVLLRLASVAVLMITLYADVGARCTEGNSQKCCRQSWENEIASQMYMLIWIDLFVVFLTTALMETIRKLLHKHTKLFRKLNVMPEFQIPKNVLDLVYGQCLIWIGTFFSPLIPAMGVVKLFLTFYLKKVSLMYNNKPSNRPYQGARSNYLFTVLLLITFFMCLVAVGWGITRVRPSCHGPFRNDYCADREIIDLVGEVISTWPSALKEIINYISTAAFIFPGLMIFFLLIYYFRSMMKVHLQMIEMLKDQLVLEGRDKRYLMEKLISSTKRAPIDEDDEEEEAGSQVTRDTNIPPSRNVNF